MPRTLALAAFALLALRTLAGCAAGEDPAACAERAYSANGEACEAVCRPCDPTGGGSPSRANACEKLSEVCAAVDPAAVWLDCKRADVDPVGASFIATDPHGGDVPCIVL